MKNGLAGTALLCLLAAPLAAQDRVEIEKDVTQGALRVKTKAGQLVECPLRHTEVQADVSGFVARVKVTQAFTNPWNEPIEAVYVFPLPHQAAVDDMSMVVGQRRIVGLIKRRREAREIYERAVAAGLTASLLEQERPNIFTQSVGNIPPGQEVRIEISYVDVLAYDRGTYEFHFPMVVGPRYIPSRVPDASRITPPVLKPGYRSGHDVGLTVRLEAGVPIRDLRVVSHESVIQRAGRSQAQVKMAPSDAIPNKDFVLRYAVAGSKPEVALLTHAPRGEDGYFLLMVQPHQMEDELAEAPPREICFLVDVSGSMSGAPTAKVVQTMRLMLQRMRPHDRIQVVTFAGQAQRLFPAYLPAVPENIARALAFTSSFEGAGGTEMLKGIRTVLADPVEPGRVRIVLMLTDGYIGNEDEIIRDVARRAGDQVRFWAVGIGASPNRHLIDGVGRQGGMSATLGVNEEPDPLVARVVDRMQRAQLGQIELDWGTHGVYETYPARIPDLWSGSPVVVVGRYRTSGPGSLRVNGVAEGQAVSFPLEVQFPEAAGEHAVLATVWARRKIADLSEQMIVAGDPLEEEITELALRYRLASAFTSFVAVDESEQARLMASPHPPRQVAVPVPMPEGVRYQSVFGFDGSGDEGLEDVIEGGVPGGLVGGVVGGAPAYAAPVPTPAPRQRMVARAFAMAAPPPAPPPPPGTMPPMMVMAEAVSVAAGPARAADATRHEQAKTDLARAGDLATRKDWLGARRALQRAWLFEETYFGASPWSDDGTRAVITAEWQSLESAYAAAMAAELRALANPLDLVIRNEDLEAALASVARAAGITLRVLPGSLTDAAELQKRETLRIAYLDLRRATAAQALGWLLGPFGLEWELEGGTVVVRSARRGPGISVWVYEVAGFQEAAQRLAEMKGAVVLDPARLLLEGDAAAHTRADKALSALPAARREKAPEKREEGLARAGAALQTHSWALLASALAGGIDDEAVSELREAWRAPGLAEALAQPDASLVLAARTAWVIAVSRRAGGSDLALKMLADEAFGVLTNVLVRRNRLPHPLASPEAELYLALLRREAGLPPTLSAHRPGSDGVLQAAAGGFEPVVASLLSGGRPDAVHALFEEHNLRGDDRVVLAAWALRAAGAEAWSRFRVAQASWLNGTGATGGALRVVSRLEASRLLGTTAVAAAQPIAEGPRPRLPLAVAGVSAGLAAGGFVVRRRRRDVRVRPS